MQTKQSHKFEIRNLNPELGDLNLSENIAILINRVYQDAEDGIWKVGASRTNVPEIEDLIKRGELVAAFVDEKIVGVVRVQLIHPSIGEFGMLAVDPLCRNGKIGSKLVSYAENKCSHMGASTMQLELLVPSSWKHSFKEYLKEWYTRIGYKKINIGSIMDSYPQLGPLLGTDCDFEIYQKQLNDEHCSNEGHVINASRLARQHLEKLFSGEILAVRIFKYCDQQCATVAASNILSQHELEQYHYEVSDKGVSQKIQFGVSRFGVSFNTAFRKSEGTPEFLRYHRSALQNIRRLRSLFAPNLSPIDQFRLELDEMWPGGASIGEFSGSKMFTGIVRVTQQNAEVLENRPHADILPPNFTLENQFSANIYLSTPDDGLGGELLLWAGMSLSHAEVDDLNKNPGLWKERLGAPITVAPQPGDLIIFNTRLPHAVRAFKKGSRVSVQTFFGYEKDGRLKLWS